MMIVNKVRGAVMAGALLSCAGWNVASAQAPAQSWGEPGTTYALHSNAAGDCPAMDWHLVVMNDGSIHGIVGLNDMKTLFEVAGTYTGATFHLDGHELGGTRSGAVNGQLQSEGRIALTLGGLPIGAACQGKTVYITRKVPAPIGAQNG
jgi:hypothetical protein